LCSSEFPLSLTVGHSRFEGTYSCDLDPVDEDAGSSEGSEAYGTSIKETKFQNTTL